MKQKLKYGLGIFFCGAMTLAGFSAVIETGKAINLVLALIFLLLTVALVRKWPRKGARARSTAPRSPADRFVRSQPMPQSDNISVESHGSIAETDQDIRIKGAPFSYLDACALKFWNQKATDYKVPSYYANSAFGRNIEPARNRLMSSNPKYLEIGKVEKSIELKKVPELKELLAARGLKISGKKSELIQRLTDNISKEELETIFPVRVYEITDAGRKALKYYSIVFANEDYNLSFPFYRLLKKKEANPSLADEEILLGLLLDDLDKADQSGERETYRVTAEKTARFLEETGKIKKAFGIYCVAFFMFWYRNTSNLNVDGPAEAYAYQAKAIDRCGKLCGYSFKEMLTQFRASVQEINPFSLGTNRNIDRAIKVFREALSV